MKHFTLALMAAAALSTQAVAQNRVKNLYTTERALNVELLQNMKQTVQLNRYLFAGYNTICLPVTMSAEQLAEAAGDVRIERLVGIRQEGSNLNLYFIDCTEEGIEAGTPYLIYSPKAQTLRITNKQALSVNDELKSVWMNDDQGNMVIFGSSWESMQKGGRYGIPAKQETTPLQSILIRTEADKTFLPTRCGFSWESQSATATDLKIKHISSMSELGVPTAIVKSAQLKNEKVTVYDLKGNVIRQQISADAVKSLPRGIYVIDGEKVAVQ